MHQRPKKGQCYSMTICKRKRWIGVCLRYILIACPLIFSFIGIIFVRTMLVTITITNHSMHPTLRDGDRVLAIRFWPSKWLRKGHIVVIWPWPSPDQKSSLLDINPYIKRIVGLSGDTLVTSVTELDHIHLPYEIAAHDDKGERVWNIPPEHIFVRGDNPIGGFDSLSWGPIHHSSVLAVVIMKLPRHLESPAHDPK